MPNEFQTYPQAMKRDPETGKPMPKVATRLTGTFVRLANEPKPTTADGVEDGDDLLLVDTKEVYIYYKGAWYVQ
jgi:hypothetical protein